MSEARAAGGDGAACVRVAFKTLGCKVNRVESEDIAADLIDRGAELSSEESADVVVINTCTVTGEADAKARKAVRHALKAPSSPVVVVTGCLAALDRDSLEALGERVIVEADKERVSDRVAQALSLREDEAPAGAHAHGLRAGEGFRTRALLKVEDGCDVFCAYCIVPHARGVPRSVPLHDAVDRAARLAAAGAAEIVLTGINLGRYSDERSGADLAALVGAVAGTGVARIRLSSIEPPDLTERLLGVLASTPAACEHLHVPLQSGSDAVLRAMRRTYTIAEYEERIDAARRALPGLAVTTDVMVGFPGESEEDAAATIAACERLGFAKLHVFRYSERPGTPAAEMPDSIAPEVRARRAAALRDCGERLRASFIASRAGRPAEVLVERVGEGIAHGTTRDYLRVELAAGEVGVGAVVHVAALDRGAIAS